jgi:hypothetical protein
MALRQKITLSARATEKMNFPLNYWKYRYFIVAAVLYAGLALLLIHYFPIKIITSDVPVNINQADSYLLKGENPYGQNYTIDVRANPYNGSENNIETVNILQYPPAMVLYYIPFYLMGDIRYGNLFADLLIYLLILIYFKNRDFEVKFAYLFLFNGLNLISNYIYGGNDIIAGLFVGISIYSLNKKEKLSAVSYGISLVTKQLSILLIPYFIFNARQKIKFLLVGVVIAVLIILPFSPQVIYDTIFGIFYRRVPLLSYFLVFYPFFFMPVLDKFAMRRKRLANLT